MAGMAHQAQPSLVDRAAAAVSNPGPIVDAAIAAVLVLATLTAHFPEPWERWATLALVAAPIGFRRQFPLLVLLVTAFGSVVTDGRGGWIDIAAVAIASFTTGDLSRNRVTSALAAIGIATAMAYGFARFGGDLALSLSLPFIVIMPAWVLGVAVRTRRHEGEARAAEVVRTQREQAAAVAAAAADERRHIARELHDVVAHAVSVMLIQTGAARQVLHTAPDQAEQSLLAVEATGRDAMAELRRLVGVLSDEDEGASRSPQSGVAQLESLVQRVRDAGLPAQLSVEGQPRPLPSVVEVTIYRIIQEALTNALRHAGRATARVRLVYAPAEVRVEVLDDGAGAAASVAETARGGTPHPGRGLIGMRERAALFGGRLEAGPLPDHGYAVRAWLPTDATPS